MNRTRTFYRRAVQYFQNRSARKKLEQLDDRMLQDIGVSRSETDAVFKSNYRRTRHFDF